MAIFVYLFLAALFLIGALYFVAQGRERAKEELIEQRLATVGMQRFQAYRRDWVTTVLERAGLSLSDTARRILALGLVVVVIAVTFSLGIKAGALVLVGILATGYTVLTVLFSRRQGMLIAQMPRLLDQVVRMMRTGKTIGDAFFIATDDAEEPLKSVMEKLRRNITLGMTIPEAFNDLAETYNLQELRVLALGISVNARFGGSLIELLNNVINLIQEREKASRQLKAMTGETRVGATLLSLMPIALGAYMMAVNPDYLMTMIDDPTGLNILIGAGCAQLAGMLVIWRMLRSI
ncbi:type II secretion system F family protein [Perlucidibaca piscinae]|uniref:type II secretion system F family protein n=1 Tax=Perlucidibaca piscinae TaxID=392589 RepID=UPI0003B35045|nr:type II secretion system F family protein [Perlucidibaca piscinae]